MLRDASLEKTYRVCIETALNDSLGTRYVFSSHEFFFFFSILSWIEDENPGAVEAKYLYLIFIMNNIDSLLSNKKEKKKIETMTLDENSTLNCLTLPELLRHGKQIWGQAVSQ